MEKNSTVKWEYVGTDTFEGYMVRAVDIASGDIDPEKGDPTRWIAKKIVDLYTHLCGLDEFVNAFPSPGPRLGVYDQTARTEIRVSEEEEEGITIFTAVAKRDNKVVTSGTVKIRSDKSVTFCFKVYE